MIYRVSGDDLRPWVGTNSQISFGKWPFFGDADIKPYTDIWKIAHIQFKSPEGDDTDEYSDITEQGGKLFLSEKAYDTLKDIFKDYGEFLPVTFNAGKGYIFNPLVGAEPIKGSIVQNIYDTRFVSSFEFDEKAINAPIFKSIIKNHTPNIFITKDVYRMIRLNGLNGLLFYNEYGTKHAEPEGGYKGSTSMPGYEDED